MKKFITIISVMAAFAAAFTSCNEEEIVGTADRDGLFLNKVELTLVKGNSEALVATVTPKGAAELTWESANTAVATVNAEGLVKAVGAGETVVTATTGERTVECVVSVKSPVTYLHLDHSDVYIYKGTETEVVATVGPDDINVPFQYTWTSSDASIFTVTPDAADPSKAVVRGIKGGFGTLYAQAGDVTTSIPVTIDVDLEGVVITGVPTGKVYKGDSFQLGVDKDPIDAIDVLSPVWSSSDETVMTVDQNGLVHAVGAGTASITVESNGFSASVELTIKVMTTISFYPSSSTQQIDEVVTFSTTGYNYGSYMYVASGYYGDINFSLAEGYVLVEVVFSTYSNNRYALECDVDSGTYDASRFTWTGEANQLAFTVKNTSYITGFKITYKG